MANRHVEFPENQRFPDGFRILQGTQEYITYRQHSSIRIWYSEIEGEFKLHTHSAVEIIMPIRGESVYDLPGRQYRVHPGEILIIPSDLPHALTESKDIVRYLVLFEPNLLMDLRDSSRIAELMRSPLYLREPSELREQTARLLRQTVNCYEQQEPMWNTQCYAYLMQMYALLGRNYLLNTGPQREPGGRTIDTAIMNSVITFINERYMDNLTLEDAALFAGFSRCYFSRVFKRFVGVSFSEYLLQRRINAAANLLIRTERPIGEIAKAAGFGSVSSFNRIFRERKNCTPTEFRTMNGARSTAAV